MDSAYLWQKQAYRNKVLGTTLHPTIGSIVQRLATTGHPRALNQHTTVSDSQVLVYHSPKRMKDRISERWNVGILSSSSPSIKQNNIGRGTTCTLHVSTCNFLLIFSFLVLFLYFSFDFQLSCFIFFFLIALLILFIAFFFY